MFYDNANKWNMSVGPRLGKVTTLVGQPVNVFGGADDNQPNTIGTGKWSFKLSVSLLFPR